MEKDHYNHYHLLESEDYPDIPQSFNRTNIYRTCCIIINSLLIATFTLSGLAYGHAHLKDRCTFDPTRIFFDNVVHAGIYSLGFALLGFLFCLGLDNWYHSEPPTEDVIDGRYTAMVLSTCTGIVSCGLGAAFSSPDPCSHGFGRR